MRPNFDGLICFSCHEEESWETNERTLEIKSNNSDFFAKIEYKIFFHAKFQLGFFFARITKWKEKPLKDFFFLKENQIRKKTKKGRKKASQFAWSRKRREIFDVEAILRPYFGFFFSAKSLFRIVALSA